MNKGRRIAVAGLGAMTPAFIATDQVQARSADATRIAPAQTSASNITLDQETLKSALLALSPAEKLGIAGDRIRLARSNVKPRVSGQAVSQRGCTQTCPAYCQLRRAR